MNKSRQLLSRFWWIRASPEELGCKFRSSDFLVTSRSFRRDNVCCGRRSRKYARLWRRSRILPNNKYSSNLRSGPKRQVHINVAGQIDCAIQASHFSFTEETVCVGFAVSGGICHDYGNKDSRQLSINPPSCKVYGCLASSDVVILWTKRFWMKWISFIFKTFVAVHRSSRIKYEFPEENLEETCKIRAIIMQGNCLKIFRWHGCVLSNEYQSEGEEAFFSFKLHQLIY